jgi:hypothetical protein
MNREKCIELSRAIMNARGEIKSIDETIYDWFEQNPLKPTLPNGVDLYNFADFLRCRYELEYSNEFIQEDISAWFEEGLKQEPVAVGLSDEQAISLIKFRDSTISDNCLRIYKDWAKTQTFTTPEVKEVPVGLSDEQVNGLIQHFKDEGILQNKLNHAWVIKGYLKTQAFAIPEVQPVSALSSAYQCLLEDNLALAKELEQLKAQQFTPDWNIIPIYVDEVEIVMNYCQGGMIDDDSNFLISYKRPTPPAPKVEIGQVWRLNNSESRVEVLLIRGDNVAVDGLDVGGLAVYEIADFVAMFERVGGSE